jgi:hypothetical protein
MNISNIKRIEFLNDIDLLKIYFFNNKEAITRKIRKNLADEKYIKLDNRELYLNTHLKHVVKIEKEN